MQEKLTEIGQHLQAGRFSEALPVIESVLRDAPRNPSALRGLSIAASALGQPQTEAALLDELAAQAGDDAGFLAYHAQALGNVGRFDESIRAFDRAIELAPTNHQIGVAYAMALLRKGEMTRGWEMYDHREAMPEVAQFSQQVKRPRYEGGNLKGQTILLLGEQGLGDTIMFARYASLLAKRGGKVVIAAHPQIADLLRTVPGVFGVARFGEQMPQFHTYARLLSLPRVFDTTLFNIPHDVPYLRPAWGRVEHWRERLKADGARKRVGLVWAGSARHTNDAQRSMHLADFAPLADVPGVTFYAIQKGDRADEATNPPANLPVTDLGPEIKDLSDMGAALATMDLLISVDTAAAHLAGAIGKPVWTLLPYSPDWRWMLNRDDSPWYPTMRLFRQPTLGDWSAVVSCVREELAKWPTTATTTT